MNLREFKNWALEKGSVANPEPDNWFKGECVSLIQQYLYQVCGIPFKARGNAKDWSKNAIEGWDILDASNSLKAGDIIIWTSGTYGHIAIIDADMKILEQNRSYNKKITVSDIRKGYTHIQRSRTPINIGEAESQSYRFAVGQTYTTQVDLKVRKGAGTDKAWKLKTELTKDGQKHAYDQKYAVLKSGTKVSCLEVANIGNDVWIRIPSGWIAGYYDEKVYLK